MPTVSRTARKSVAPRRRGRKDAPSCQLRVGPVHVFSDQLLVRIERERAWLTPREMEVLAVFAGRPGRLLTRAEVYEQVWQRPFSPRDRPEPAGGTSLTRYRRR